MTQQSFNNLTKDLIMIIQFKRAIQLGGAFGIIVSQLSTPVMADIPYNPNWPSVQCKDGTRFQYQLNGAPTYASAAEKCAKHGGIDNGPTKTLGKPVTQAAVKGRKAAIPEVTPGCTSTSGVQNQNTC
jgi:hypothetical protein